MTTTIDRTNDGFADDAEYLDNVACNECDNGKADAKPCDNCGVVECCVTEFTCAAGYAPDGMNLCDDCAPTHRGCPECDPPDRDDR